MSRAVVDEHFEEFRASSPIHRNVSSQQRSASFLTLLIVRFACLDREVYWAIHYRRRWFSQPCHGGERLKETFLSVAAVGFERSLNTNVANMLHTINKIITS